MAPDVLADEQQLAGGVEQAGGVQAAGGLERRLAQALGEVGLTLAGFARGDRVNVYAGAARVSGG